MVVACRLGLAERLAVADEAISGSFRGDFVTAQVAQLSTVTGTLNWVNAGHPLPMLVRDGVVVGELTCAPRPPVGLHRLHSRPTVVETVQLQRSDRVLFYTDGLVEGGRRGGSRFGVERLADLLSRAHSEGLGCAETIRQLGHRVLEHADYELNDDATMLLVEWAWHPTRQQQPLNPRSIEHLLDLVTLRLNVRFRSPTFSISRTWVTRSPLRSDQRFGERTGGYCAIDR